MLLTTLTVASTMLASAAVALYFWGKHPSLKKTTSRYGVGAGSGNVQGDGNHIHYHQQQQDQALAALLKETELLKEQNAHLRRQNKRLTKQNTCVLSQLEVMNRMLDSYHSQMLRQETNRSKVPLLRMAAKIG